MEDIHPCEAENVIVLALRDKNMNDQIATLSAFSDIIGIIQKFVIEKNKQLQAEYAALLMPDNSSDIHRMSALTEMDGVTVAANDNYADGVHFDARSAEARLRAQVTDVHHLLFDPGKTDISALERTSVRLTRIAQNVHNQLRLFQATDTCLTPAAELITRANEKGSGDAIIPKDEMKSIAQLLGSARNILEPLGDFPEFNIPYHETVH